MGGGGGTGTCDWQCGVPAQHSCAATALCRRRYNLFARTIPTLAIMLNGDLSDLELYAVKVGLLQQRQQSVLLQWPSARVPTCYQPAAFGAGGQRLPPAHPGLGSSFCVDRHPGVLGGRLPCAAQCQRRRGDAAGHR